MGGDEAEVAERETQALGRAGGEVDDEQHDDSDEPPGGERVGEPGRVHEPIQPAQHGLHEAQQLHVANLLALYEQMRGH